MPLKPLTDRQKTLALYLRACCDGSLSEWAPGQLRFASDSVTRESPEYVEEIAFDIVAAATSIIVEATAKELRRRGFA